MIIEIKEDIFNKMLSVAKGRNSKLYDELVLLKPINLTTLDTLAKARTIKTVKVKERIRIALYELIQAKEQPSRYKVHKHTKITYNTLKKYYDEILDEVLSER